VSDLSVDLKKIFGIRETPFILHKREYSPKFMLLHRLDIKNLEERLEHDPKSIFQETVDERYAQIGDEAARTKRIVAERKPRPSD
jgi:hypothetical protein